MPEQTKATPRSSAEYPTLFRSPLASAATAFWTIFFFVAFNLAALAYFRDRHGFQRFGYQTSYEEIREQIDALKKDPRKKVVFLGGSVVWGASVRDDQATIPSAFQKLVPTDTVVYNFGIVGARPVDEFLMAWLIGDSADAIIMDNNYEFYFDVPHDRLLRTPETYVRLQQLFSTEGNKFLDAIPGIRECLRERGLPVPKNKNAVEVALRSTLERFIPLLRLKNRINEVIFGVHPALILDTVLTHASALMRGDASSVWLLLHGEAHDSTPWKPTGSQAEKDRQGHYFKETFSPDSMNACITEAFGRDEVSLKTPVFAYLTPTNPRYFPGFHTTPLHERNVALIEHVFGSGSIMNLDDGSLPGNFFTDATHLTPEGNVALARKLWNALKDDPTFTHALR